MRHSTLASALMISASLLPSLAIAATETASKDELKAAMTELRQQRTALIKQEKDLAEQRQKLDRQQSDLEGQKQKFNALLDKVQRMAGGNAGSEPVAPATKTTAAATASAAAANEATNQSTDTSTDNGEVGTDKKPTQPEKPPELAVHIDEGGVLLPKGKLEITPAAEYSRSSATRVAIQGFSIIPALNIGAFEVTQVNRDTLTGSMAARLGVTNRFEIDAKIPYLYRNDATRSRPFGAGSGSDTLSEVSGMGVGDVEFGAHYQINNGAGGWPYFIANIRAKTATGTSPFDVPTDPTTGLQTELPTGSGFYALQPSVTAIYPSDPAVFYGNVGYLYNIGRNVGNGVGEIKPGDSISASFGMSVSLNDRSSFSLGYAHNTVLETTRDGESLPNGALLQVGTVDLGYSYRLNKRTSLNFLVNAGITEDAPDSRVTLRVPYSFELF